jgi:hypothetical protein
MKLGNFAFYKGQFVILIANQKTLMGNVWTVMNLKTKDVALANEQQLTPYTRKARGVKPASDMTERQQKAITFVKNQLNAHFNGRSLSDVSTFLGLFLNDAKQTAYYDYLRQVEEDGVLADANSPW